MITVIFCFAHSFKIMCVTQPIIPFCAPPQPVQVLRSGRGGEIDVQYIRCLDGRVPEAYELWALAQDEVYEVQPYARVELLSYFREDTFYTNFFNARRFQIPFLGRRAVNECRIFLLCPYNMFEVKSLIGLKTSSFTPGISILVWSPLMCLLSRDVHIIFHLLSTDLSCGPIINASYWSVLSQDESVLKSCSPEFIKTFVTRFVLMFMSPLIMRWVTNCPMIPTPMTAGSWYTSLTPNEGQIIWTGYEHLYLSSTARATSKSVFWCPCPLISVGTTIPKVRNDPPSLVGNKQTFPKLHLSLVWDQYYWSCSNFNWDWSIWTAVMRTTRCFIEC